MNIKELKGILDKEEVWEGAYDILDKNFVPSYDGFISTRQIMEILDCIMWNGGSAIYCFKRIQKNRSALNFCA